MRTSDSDNGGIYRHRELPHLNAELMGEYVLEATSARARGSLAHRGELWDRAYQELMERTDARMKQEIGRRGRVAVNSTVGRLSRQSDPLGGLGISAARGAR